MKKAPTKTPDQLMTTRRKLSLLAFCVGLFVTLGATQLLANDSPKSDLSRPNVVLIMADDMGFGDVQALNGKSKIPTPYLNSLAAEGMTFVDAHSPSAVCTPTRYALVTGRYCWRTKLKRGVLNGYGEPLIDKQRSTLASVLKSAGYDTGVVGKWHLGLGFAKDPSKKENKGFDFSKPIDHGPNDLGWDYSFVIPASLDFPPYIYIKNHAITQFPSIREKNRQVSSLLAHGRASP